MHRTTLIITFSLTLAAHTSAAPISTLAPHMRPLATAVSNAPASIATDVANITAGKLPDHKHNPDCEHIHNATHTRTSHDAADQNLTSGLPRGPTNKGAGLASTKPLANDPSPYPGFNASAYSHTGEYGDHHDHRYNTTITGDHNTTIIDATTNDATDGEIVDPRVREESESAGSSLNNHTNCHCARAAQRYNGTLGHEGNATHHNSSDYPSCTHTHPAHHHNATPTVPQRTHKRDTLPLLPRVDVTVCLGADCKDTEIVTAELGSIGELEGIHTKDGTRMAKRQDTEISYRDVARQLDGAMIAGGI